MLNLAGKRAFRGSMVATLLTTFLAAFMAKEGALMASSVAPLASNHVVTNVVTNVVSDSTTNTLNKFFSSESLTQKDSVLVTEVLESGGQVDLFDWQARKPLIPASTAKLATSYFAIQKWGLSKRFETIFFLDGNTLWVKGMGDPYIVSEELDLIAEKLQQFDMSKIDRIAIDDLYFSKELVPGRSGVRDPYNAPLNAVSANFNTVKVVMASNVQKGAKQSSLKSSLESAEPQTPLTPTAKRVTGIVGVPRKGKPERINLIEPHNAASHFAELLSIKLGLHDLDIVTGRPVPADAKMIYVHKNTRNLADIVRGMLEYSNNFMANQLFLMFSNESRASFSNAAKVVETYYKNELGWQNFSLVEGAGLSRKNRLTARQINDLLIRLGDSKELLKSYPVKEGQVWAKTGTLSGVRSFAGFISKQGRNYQFVFNFNRPVSYRYREALMQRLVASL